MIVYFEEIATRRTKRAACEKCGKKYQKTEKFWQTISPWNTDGKGLSKTKEGIWKEINIKADNWMSDPMDAHVCK